MLRTIVLLTFFCLASSLMKAQYSKIDAFLQTALEQAPDEQYHEVYILLDEQIDLQFLQQNANNNGKRRHEKRKDILKAAQQLARHTQPLIQTKLENLAGVEPYSLQAYWIVNGFQVRANAKAIRTISQWSEVQWIEPVQENILFDKAAKGVSMPSSPNRAEQGLKAINAHKMWELGYTGYGTKVLVVDSGNALEHPALYHNFWGNNVPVEHAWTGQALPEACNNHGTQVTGVIAGLDRTTNDTIGVAPNAHWMGAPLNIGDCSLRQDIRNTVQVFEWAIDPDGNINTTEDSPDVINNSWGNASPVCERTYTDILTLLEALDIAVVWAGGNSGQEGAMSVYGTQNINATLVNTFTVGNLNGRTLNISDDSSRGPSYCGLSGSLAIKPEVSAPGQSIRSATIDGEYNAVSGTSFSAPHVAGALLLLREAFPEVSSENLKLALYYSARDLGQAGEDNAYGMGIIDVFAAYQYLIAEGNTPTPPVSTANDAVMVDIQTTRAVHCLGSVAVSVTFENNGENTLNTLQIEYFVEDNIQDTKTITWNGTLEKNEVASINLTDLDELPAGQHELNVRISAPNGQVDTRPLNNAMKNYIEIVDLEYVRAELDVTYANAICENARAVLHSASPLEEGQEIVWYDRPEGSVSLNVGRLGEGTPFLTDPIEASTTFYADLRTSSKVGSTGTTEEATATAAELGILFDVEQPLFLKSVKVFAEGRGARFIKILDAEENVVLSKIANLDDGENIVQLDKALNIGSDYTIILSSPSKPLRIGTSASFPYEIPGTIKLNRSTGSFLKYYYFFDWEIQTLHACGRTPITLSVNNTSDAPNVGIAVSAEQVAEDAATVEFNSISDSDLNAHWSFGDSNESTDRNPVHTYSQAGEYVVTHTVTDGMGCTNAVQKTILVEEDTETTSVQDITDENAVTIFPNPATEQVILQTRRTTPIQVRVTDFLGKSIAVPVSRLNSTGLRLNTTNLPDGVYYIIIDLNGKQLSKKLIKLN